MLARYKIYRAARPAGKRLPEGIRQDTRKHTKHCLRPSEEIVADYLAKPTAIAWTRFKAKYLRILKARFKENPTPFDNLARLATDHEVYIGCSCPTLKNPDVNQCHTVLALQFMNERYPELAVEFP